MQISKMLTSNPTLALVPGEMIVIGVLVLILCFLMALYLLNKIQAKKETNRTILDDKVHEARSQELEWYREKRFLMERQAREKQSRLAMLIESIAPENAHRMTYPASRLFFLSESIREERQHLGTDISKLSLIDRRLRKLGKECIKQSGKGVRTENWLSKMSMCRQIIQSNLEDLRKSQNLLRNVLGSVSTIEEKARANDISNDEMPELIAQLEDIKSKLSELPDGLRTVAKSTGEQAQALFKESTRHIPDEVLHSVWKEQTTLDLFSSKHRPGGRSELLSSAETALSSLHGSSVLEDDPNGFWDSESDVEAEVVETEIITEPEEVEAEAEIESTEETPEPEETFIDVETVETTSEATEGKTKQEAIPIGLADDGAEPLIGVTSESKEEEEIIVEDEVIEAEVEAPVTEPIAKPVEDEVVEIEATEAEEDNVIEEMTSDLLEEQEITLEETDESPAEEEPSASETDDSDGYRFATSSSGLFEFPKKETKDEELSEGYRFSKGEDDEEEVPKFIPASADDEISAVEKTGETAEDKNKVTPGDAVWATPLDFGLDAATTDKKPFRFNPYSDPKDDEKTQDHSSLVIFRSNDPEIWNTTTNNGDDSRSIAIHEISGEVKWLGLKRIDTGEEVFSEITLDDLKRAAEGKTAGFNGTNEYFYGARHLGFFSEECPTEVETLFTYGGWGFGHLATSTDDVVEQAWGWNGQRIANETVFEFTLYEQKPERVKDDQIVI